MMDLYYDPILGLIYTTLNPKLIINMAAIPPDFDLQDAIYYLKQTGVVLVNSQEQEMARLDNNQKITFNAYFFSDLEPEVLIYGTGGEIPNGANDFKELWKDDL